MKIAYGNSRMEKKWKNNEISWEDFCKRVSTTQTTTETVDEYRKMSKPQQDSIKDVGGFVAGHLKAGRRKNGTVLCRSMLTLDMDHGSADILDELDMFNSHKMCIYSTHKHTPEAPRLRLIMPLKRDVSEDEYPAVARKVAQEIGMDMFDDTTYQPHRLMYWPSTSSNGEYIYRVMDGDIVDPDYYLGLYDDWRDVSTWPVSSRESEAVKKTASQQADPLTKDGVVGAFCRTYSIRDAIDKFLGDVYEPSAMEGRYDYIPADSSAGVTIIDDKFSYSFHATDPACGQLLNAFDVVRVHKFPDDDPKKSFKAMAKFASSDEEVKLLIFKEKQESAAEDFDEEDPDAWKKKLEYEDKSLQLRNTLRNLTLILENDPNLMDIVFNQHLDGMEIKGDVPWKHPSKFWRDADDAQLISYVDENYGTFSQRNYDIAVAKVTDDRSYHPIREFLQALPEWDKVERVDTLLIDYLGAADNKYVRAVTRKTLCAAACRVLNPGCKFDTMLVLNGSQGIGKSTLIAKLGGEWFSDSLSLNDTKDKTAAEKLQGYWILEIGELAGLRKAEVETLRSFLSRQNDIYRASFGKRTTPHPRQCVFFGTTNAESGYLRDTTGNRRFWPVKTPGGGSKRSWDVTQEDVLQIWAEVMHYVKAGEKLYLDPEVEALAKAEQREAMESDEREGLVREYLEALLPDNWDDMDTFERRNFLDGTGEADIGKKGTVRRTQVCNMEIWCECFGKERSNLKRADSNELSGILVKLGWVRLDRKERVANYGPQFIFVPKERN
ncbi:virulence-associated E family protein [Dorea sp. YH-dor226]|uniref:virulence-associated E family protein n=1 Tax=Dorea sp. YH-dor226 TaxID=3151119 RepID=UPI003242CA25